MNPSIITSSNLVTVGHNLGRTLAHRDVHFIRSVQSVVKSLMENLVLVFHVFILLDEVIAVVSRDFIKESRMKAANPVKKRVKKPSYLNSLKIVIFFYFLYFSGKSFSINSASLCGG